MSSCSLTADPHEKEVLFPPLMGIEVVGTRVRIATLVVNAKVSLNLVAQTLEQVSDQRATASALLGVGVWRALAPRRRAPRSPLVRSCAAAALARCARVCR